MFQHKKNVVHGIIMNNYELAQLQSALIIWLCTNKKDW